MNKYGVEVILYYPDSIAFGNIKNYQSIFDHVLLYDNTPKADIKYSIEDDQKTTYLSNGINDGMSVALEEGIKWADNNNIDFLLTMDQDSDLAIEDAKRIQQRISENDEEKVAIYSINYRKIVYKEKKPILLEARYKQGKDIDVNFSMTSGSFVRIKAVKKLLPLDNLFIGFVDNDLCYGLREKGYQIRLVSDVIFNQRVGEPIEDKLFNRLLHRLILTEDRYYMMGRNSAYLKRKYNIRKIREELMITRMRIWANIFFCEKDKKKKLHAWIKGSNEWRTLMEKNKGV